MNERNFIEELKKVADFREDTAEKIKSHNLPVIVFGAGNQAETVTKDLASYGIKVFGYAVDEKYYKPHKTFLGQPIYNFAELYKTPEKFVFILGLGFIAAQRMLELVNDEKIFVYSFIGLEARKENYIDLEYVFENREKFSETYTMLEDEFSRKTMIAYLKTKISNNVSYTSSVFHEKQYFNELTLDSTRGGAERLCRLRSI